MKPLALAVSVEAQRLVDATMRDREDGSLPALFFASEARTYDSSNTLVRTDPPHWYIGVYTPDQVRQLSVAYAEHGHAFVYAAQKLVLCVPQQELVVELAGKTLCAEGSRVWVS